ncbi:MAG: hypothetical protein ACU836_18705 [Gammaproteobacteria bacterium]
MPVKEFPLTDEAGNLCVVPPASGIPLKRFLTANGDGSGEYNLNGDYSASALTAYYEATSRFELASVLVNISDGTKFLQNAYGGIALGTVANGVKFFIQPVGLPDIQLLTTFGITQNYQWLSVTPDAPITQFDLTPQTMTPFIDLKKLYGKYLNMNVGDKFKIVLNDDFTGLVNHSFILGGTLF